jgi:mannan endo-1,4-beta-mannosidase
MITKACNKNAIPEVEKLLDYLAGIEGKGILTGQHTQTMKQEELAEIEKITGKLPALCGFELLAYSPNIRRDTADEACLTEVDENAGTLEKAWEWVAKGGIVTFTWHWFSPLGGKDKSFYAENTDFDAEKAVKTGTEENAALCRDMDAMAKLLKPFCEKRIPILWRPFHESEGEWFWWGAKGPAAARELYHFMYHYFTEKHELNNLIWVWNSPLAEGYVGDAYCDIISQDIYSEAHVHRDYAKEYCELKAIPSEPKGVALAENGILPAPEALVQSGTSWLWYMTWSKGFVMTEEYNTREALRRLYNHPYAITLDKLPKLYA